MAQLAAVRCKRTNQTARCAPHAPEDDTCQTATAGRGGGISGRVWRSFETPPPRGTWRGARGADLNEHVVLHVGRQQRLVPAVGLLLQQVGRGVLRGERQRCQGVHDEVDPQQLQHREGRAAPGDGCDKGHGERHQVDGQLELQELADVAEDAAPPLHRLDNRAEVVVEDDDVGGLLGDVGAANALTWPSPAQHCGQLTNTSATQHVNARRSGTIMRMPK